MDFLRGGGVGVSQLGEARIHPDELAIGLLEFIRGLQFVLGVAASQEEILPREVERFARRSSE